MRSLGITLISLGLTSVVIGNAYYQKKQFYPSVVYITKSNPSMAVIYVQAFILVILVGKLMRKVFFGQLRAAEFEHLVERSWYAVTETCLAFTMFRDDFSPKFVALFILLLFLKCFHWLAEDRVDFMERSPVLSHLFHVRIVSLLMMLAGLDMHFVEHAYHSTVTKGASVQLVFGFEYAILLTIVFNITIKYTLHTIDLNSDSPWENKAVFLLYTELVMGFIKVILYITFVAIMVRIYTLPLFAFRPMYYTMRSFKKAFNDVILSRRAIRNMNTLYPDATPEELAAADNVCIICREEMVSASKKLPCNHIFHTACLRSWFQRQQTCPTCRLNILRTPTPPQPAPQQHQQQQQPQQPQQQVPLVVPPPVIPQMPPGGLNIPPFVGPLPFWQMFQPQLQAQPQQQQQQQQQQRTEQQPATAAAATSSIPAGAAAGGSADGTASQQQASAAPAGAAASAATATATAQGSTSAGGSGTAGMPFICPPLPFMPFIPPPPVPPPNLAAFTTEELHRMEGSTREAVEARLQCLRNIQLLLDASVAMMQQYASVAVRIEQVTTTKVSNDQVLTAAAETNDKESNSSPAVAETAAAEVGPSAEVAAAPASSDSSSSSSNDRPETYPASNSSSDANNSNSNEQEEIRRRRLQRFAQASD